MASTEFEKRKEEEYEMQLLCFHSRAVYATLEGIVHDTIESTCKKLCKSLQTKYNCDGEELRELMENERKLMQIYYARARPHLKIIENIVKKYISIPKNVLLEGDKCQSISYTEEEYERLDERMRSLQQRAKRATILNSALKEELATVDQLQNHINKSNKMCDIVESISVDRSTNNGDMLKVLQHYEELYKKLLNLVPKTDKVKYNPFEDFKGKTYDFESL